MHGNTVLEISWTIIPALILAVMAVPTVATIFDLAKMPEGRRRRARQRRPRGSGSGSTRTPTGHASVVHRQRDAHPGRTSRSISRCRRHLLDRRRATATASSTRSGSRSSPARRTSCPATQHVHELEADRDRARSSASAPSTAASRTPNMRLRVIAQTERRLRRRGPKQQTPARRDRPIEFARRHRRARGAARRATRSRASKARSATVGPNLTHLGDRSAFAGDIYAMTLDEPHEVGLRRARAASRSGR